MNFILFNGPPRSGKDTAAKIAWDYIAAKPDYMAIWEKFSFPNKRMFAGMMDTKCDNWGVVPHWEDLKGEIDATLGVSYRQWQIDVSEKFMKPLYGNDIFGRLLLGRCKECEEDLPGFTPIFIVSDCGFQIEVDTLKGHNVLLYTLQRHGTSFDGDSREYVRPFVGWAHKAIPNNSTLTELKGVVEGTVAAWLNQ